MKEIEISGVKLKWLGHAGFYLKYQGLVIYVDPFKLSESEKADVILITHGHYDHCSPEDIAKIVKKDTDIVITPDNTSKLARRIPCGMTHLIEPGKKIALKDGIGVEAVPAYNLRKEFHPKENQWVGYIITLHNTRFYHAGDTDCIPELSSIKSDVAILPVGGTYTMNAAEAAELCNTIKPRLAIPMHWGSIVGNRKDAERFKELCKCEVRILG